MADDTITINQQQEEPYSYDAMWKEFVMRFWREILHDFMPDFYEAADTTREAESLDKELHEILADETGQETRKSSKRYVDCLLKIYLKNGGEEWVLLHIEIQGRGGEAISLRMFRYLCLLFLKYKRHPAAMAILTAKRLKKEGDPGIYRADVFGTKTEYRYHTIKAYEYDDDELLSSDSPVKLFIYAVKIAAKFRKSDSQKYEYMRKIVELLRGKGWDITQRRNFLIMLEAVMSFSNKEYRTRFNNEALSLLGWEVGENMRPKTITEAIFEDGVAQGMAQGIAQGRDKDARNLIRLGLLTDEQIASVTEQTPEYVAKLRKEVEA